MTQTEIRISLDIHQMDSQTTLELRHFDSSKILKISLTDNGLPYEISEECRAIFVASKADETYIINECSIEDNVISYPVTTQTTSATGPVLCEIRLTWGDDNILLTSPKFSIFVVPTVYENGGAASASKNEFDALSKLITDSKNMISEIESSLERGDFIGEKGEKGDRGDAGVSPTVEVTPIDNGNRVSITDINGTTDFDVHHGNGVNEYDLTFYSDTPTESQQLIEKATIMTIMNDTADHIVYINYDDGKHPASIYQYGGAIYFYFISPNEKCWFEISYFTNNDFLQYGKFNVATAASITNMEQTSTSNEDGGANTFTFTLSDGATADFTVKNGNKGSDGTNGLSAYEIAKNHGFEGSEEEWLESLKGADGAGGSGSADAVTYTAQTLTAEQQAQARANIDAVSGDEAATAVQTLTAQFLPRMLPAVTTDDNEKFLQVVDGKWEAVTIELAEDGGF